MSSAGSHCRHSSLAITSTLLALLALLLTGCASSTHTAAKPTPTPQPPPTPVTTALGKASLFGLTFNSILYPLGAWPQPGGDDLYYVADYSPTSGVRDASGVRMYKGSTGKLFNQPVQQAQDGLEALALYQHTGAAIDLAVAVEEGVRLIGYHTINASTGQAWWYPYPFNFEEYGDPAYIAQAPWVSGMAQGEVLGLFTRLYEVTHQARWQEAAQHTFQSFTYPLKASEKPSDHPWVWQVESGGWLWIEEYPTPNPQDNTINGFGFALDNLIEYTRTFPDAQATTLIQGGLTTFAEVAIPHVRHPGSISSYSYSHMTDLSAKYHLIVTHELKLFAGVTGNSAFATLAADFYQDYHGKP